MGKCIHAYIRIKMMMIEERRSRRIDLRVARHGSLVHLSLHSGLRKCRKYLRRILELKDKFENKMSCEKRKMGNGGKSSGAVAQEKS